MLELVMGRPLRKVIYEKVVFPRRKEELETGKLETGKLETGKLETGKLETGKLDKTGKQKPVLKRKKSEQKIPVHHLTRSTFIGSVDF
jgi:hypothetical protein